MLATKGAVSLTHDKIDTTRSQVEPIIQGLSTCKEAANH